MLFNHFNRRLHIYLALLLLPWILMYGVSSFVINHGQFFQKYYEDGVPQWNERFQRAYDREIPDGLDEAGLRTVAAQILEDIELEGTFYVYRPNPGRLNINVRDFWSATRATYDIKQETILVEDRRFQWNHFFGGMHERSGYQHDSFLNDAWAVIVDLTCLGFMILVASGLTMWWQLKKTRLWGSLAIGGGVLSFVALLLTL